MYGGVGIAEWLKVRKNKGRLHKNSSVYFIMHGLLVKRYVSYTELFYAIIPTFAILLSLQSVTFVVYIAVLGNSKINDFIYYLSDGVVHCLQ